MGSAMTMDENLIRSISGVCSVITTVIAVVGVSGLLLSFKNSANAIYRDEQRKSDDLIAKLYTIDIDIKKSMAAFPKLREYLFDDESGEKFKLLQLGKNDDNEVINKARLFSGVYGNYFEYFLIHEQYIEHPEKKKLLRKVLNDYLKFVCDYSYVFRYHLTNTKPIWSKDLLDMVEAAEARFQEKTLRQSRS
jgi:hypothetical protein